MARKKESDAEPRCVCGRRLADAHSGTYRRGEHRWTYYRCECGVEWSRHDKVPDRYYPVTPGEILEVHEALEHLDGPLTELLTKEIA